MLLVPDSLEELPEPAVSLEGLAKSWEDDEEIRRFLLRNDALLEWPSPAKTGVITFDTMQLNPRVLEKVLLIWCPQLASAKTVNIEDVRKEVGPLSLRVTCQTTSICSIRIFVLKMDISIQAK